MKISLENVGRSQAARQFLTAGLLLIAAGSGAAIAAPPAADSKKASGAAGAANSSGSGWRALFDGKSLEGWKSTNFGGEGDVVVKDGMIILEFGTSLTGISYKDASDLPKTNYEVELQAMRLDGSDFFCGLTFPVADSFCSFIVGGWAGGVVGLSSIDGRDASENDTTRYKVFDSNRWYTIRVRVTPANISAWIDDQQMVDQDIENRRVSTRAEVDLSQPLGVASYETRAALRNIRIRRLDAAK